MDQSTPLEAQGRIQQISQQQEAHFQMTTLLPMSSSSSNRVLFPVLAALVVVLGTTTTTATIHSSSSSRHYWGLQGSSFTNEIPPITSSQRGPSLSCTDVIDSRSSFCLALNVPRGGSTESSNDKEDKDEADDDKEKKDDNDEPFKKSTPSTKSSEPVKILIKSNLDNKVVDVHELEINAMPSRNVESIKNNLARVLPGKPPATLIRLIHDGRVLGDDVLVQELLDDEEDDDDDDKVEGNKADLTLVLDMVPPVDPRTFARDLKEYTEELSTADLLEAYALNEAAIWFSSQFITSSMRTSKIDDHEEEDEEEDKLSSPLLPSASSPLISFQLRQYATKLKSQLEENLVAAKTASLLEDHIPPAKAAAELAKKPQIKGQRVRPALMGAGTMGPSSAVGLKQNVQHFLNIHWGETLRNFFLFLFFGWFGGRTIMSRAILLIGAPMCFIIQARPVKLFWKQFFYIVLRNPPSLLLSLLPAPQQGMLSLSDDDAMQMIYGDEYIRSTSRAEAEVKDENDEQEDDLRDLPNTSMDEKDDEYDDEDEDEDAYEDGEDGSDQDE